MKRIIAVLLSMIMLLSLCSTFAFAAENEKEPLIILRGYGTSVLYDNSTGNMVWPISDLGQKVTGIIDHYRLSKIIPKIKTNYSENLFMRVLVDAAIDEIFEPLKLNDDGTSYNPNIVAYPYNIANFETDGGTGAFVNASPKYYTYKFLKENDDYAKVITKETLCEQFVNDNGISDDMIFIFNYDLRMGQKEYANAINEFIKDVKAYTGADKVDLFGTSHGGQQTASYLSYFPEEAKASVRRAVMEAPAIGGTSLAGEIFNGNLGEGNTEIELSVIELFLNRVDPTVIQTIEKFVGLDQDLLNDTVDYLVKNYLDGFVNVMSLWDFVPSDTFDAAITYCESKGYLDPNKASDAALIAKTTDWHNMMNNYYTMFADLKDDIDLYIIANYGTSQILKHSRQSDLIIDLCNATGATVADYGTTLANGQIYDASTGFLPETTFYINGGIHGKFENDTYCMGLIKAIYNGEVESVNGSYAQDGTLNEVKKSTADTIKETTQKISKKLDKAIKNSKLFGIFSK